MAECYQHFFLAYTLTPASVRLINRQEKRRRNRINIVNKLPVRKRPGWVPFPKAAKGYYTRTCLSGKSCFVSVTKQVIEYD